jgi:hypothetical protein
MPHAPKVGLFGIGHIAAKLQKLAALLGRECIRVY